MRYRALTVSITAIVALHLAFAVQASAARPKLVVVVAHGAMLEDITAAGLPNFGRFVREGAIGVMTTRTAGDPTDELESETGDESSCVTIGAGARAIAGTEARQAFNSSEMATRDIAAVVYKRLTLRNPPPESILNLAVYLMRNNNASLAYTVVPGLAGQSLHSGGLTTACVGNSDTDTAPHREATAICMDAAGVVDFGDVSEAMVRSNSDAPFGVETDQQALLRAFDKAFTRADVIVVDTGDIARADWYSVNCLDARAAKMRGMAVKRVDRLLGQLLSRLRLNRDRLLFVSTTPSKWEVLAERKLTPVAAIGAGVAPGLLTSGSTHIAGLVMNTDLAPSLLGYFGVQTPSFASGRAITSVPGSETVSRLADLDRKLTLQSNRLVIMRTLAALLTIAIILATVLRSHRAISSPLVILPVMVAPLMVIVPVFGSHSAAITAAILAVMLAATYLIIHLLHIEPSRAVVWLSAALCGLLAVDLLRGGVWLANSPLSYSPADGARYYGLGNELMGSFLGAAAVLALALAHERSSVVRKALALACIGLPVVFCGASGLGANAGGALAALTTAGAASGVLYRDKMNHRRWLLVIAGMVAAFALFVAADMLRGAASQSHIARAFGMLGTGGVYQFGLIVERKVAMNLLLVQSSAWSKLLFATLAALAYMKFVEPGRKTFPWPAAVRVVIIGATAAFVFNDSGVVAAATCIVYAWSLAMAARPGKPA